MHFFLRPVGPTSTPTTATMTQRVTWFTVYHIYRGVRSHCCTNPSTLQVKMREIWPIFSSASRQQNTVFSRCTSTLVCVSASRHWYVGALQQWHLGCEQKHVQQLSFSCLYLGHATGYCIGCHHPLAGRTQGSDATFSIHVVTSLVKKRIICPLPTSQR